MCDATSGVYADAFFAAFVPLRARLTVSLSIKSLRKSSRPHSASLTIVGLMRPRVCNYAIGWLAGA